MLSLQQICQTAWDLSAKCGFVPDCLVFGSDDYCANIGATRTKESYETLFARQYVVMVAKAFKLQAIDVVYIDFKDPDGLRKSALEGAQFGFTGKQIIHPGQIQITQDAFSPFKERIEWASQLVTAFQQHQESGKGAFTFREAMIDMPLLRQAQNLLQLAKAIGKM